MRRAAIAVVAVALLAITALVVIKQVTAEPSSAAERESGRASTRASNWHKHMEAYLRFYARALKRCR